MINMPAGGQEGLLSSSHPRFKPCQARLSSPRYLTCLLGLQNVQWTRGFIRSQRSFANKSYMPPFREEDSEGKLGITIHNDELQVFGEVLQFNVTMLGAQI
uniref:Uncharacterized protein n=1 Tax=Salix viminalis TaxID=40686 RepID=A0A6N2NEN5_SALVM